MGQQFLLIIHMLLAIAIIGLVLLQQGKGAEVGAAFGGGASQTVFGSKGTTSFLAKLTAMLALAFAITSLTMGYLTTHKTMPKSLLEKIQAVQQAEEIPQVLDNEVVTNKVVNEQKSLNNEQLETTLPKVKQNNKVKSNKQATEKVNKGTQ